MTGRFDTASSGRSVVGSVRSPGAQDPTGFTCAPLGGSLAASEPAAAHTTKVSAISRIDANTWPLSPRTGSPG